ncbi:MAG TPA: hypothetical protein VIT19_00275 [Pyrinomonadaceae bacterium]
MANAPQDFHTSSSTFQDFHTKQQHIPGEITLIVGPSRDTTRQR